MLRETQDAGWVASEYAHGARVRMHSSFGIDQHIERDVMGDVLGVSELSSGFHARFERDPLGDELTRTVGKVRSRWIRDTSGHPLTHVIENDKETLRAVGYQ